ncbi:response regulator [Roseomonas sp. OT10]|uniref:response regulator n=1 Tax=Roseomonas cutis TaxID=2897332 RepID=UPI001E33C5EE|nr:response regulator [Roseomonas sp. OT10]UFN49161.1 response regulator [Roseomonas sp. OT10]
MEDDELVREALLMALEEEDFVVRSASDPAEALQILGSEPHCGVLVTDIDLGVQGLDGFEMATQARRVQPDVRVIFMTGRVWRLEDRPLRSNERALPKPFKPTELISLVTKLL